MTPKQSLTEGQTHCRMCDGKGATGPVHINRGDKPHEWRENMPCRDCDGTGVWSAERFERWQAGQKLRSARILNDESLREAAKRMGIGPAELSAIEAGRRALSQEQK